MKTCLYFTSDLMFSSRVKPVAAEAGYEVKFPGMQEITLQQTELVIIDLEFVSAEDLSEIMASLGAIKGSLPRIIAYGPHVKTAKLDAARQAGIDEVWTRGQFNHNFASLFRD